MTRLTPHKFVQRVLASFMAESGLEPRLFGPHLKILYAREGFVNFELAIKKGHTNRLKIIHGGTIASLVDLGGSLAVASKGYYATGVSTDLNVSYLSSGGKVGDTIFATAVCDKIGKTLAYTQVTFRDSEKNLVARGSHTKFVALAVAAGEPFVVPKQAKLVPEAPAAAAAAEGPSLSSSSSPEVTVVDGSEGVPPAEAAPEADGLESAPTEATPEADGSEGAPAVAPKKPSPELDG